MEDVRGRSPPALREPAWLVRVVSAGVCMELAPVLERLRLADDGLDAHAAVGFVLHCFMEEELSGGPCERQTVGLVETVKYVGGVEMQIVPMGASLAVHVLKPGCKPLHWVFLIAEFAPTWNEGNAADSLADGLAGLRQAFEENITVQLARQTAADTATSMLSPLIGSPKPAAAGSEAQSVLEEPIVPTPVPRVSFPHHADPRARPDVEPGGIHMPGAGPLGGLAPPLGGAGGMLIGPDHPGFGSVIGPDGDGMPAHGPGGPIPGARWDPIHGQGRLGDPDAGNGGHADLHRPPSGIDDTDVDSMFM